jgi:hypothetical protein
VDLANLVLRYILAQCKTANLQFVEDLCKLLVQTKTATWKFKQGTPRQAVEAAYWYAVGGALRVVVALSVLQVLIHPKLAM